MFVCYYRFTINNYGYKKYAYRKIKYAKLNLR